MNLEEVYYKPHNTDGENGASETPDIYIYEKPGAKESLKNPVQGEVIWVPHFDLKSFEANDKRSKDHLHRWFWYRCWQYLAAKNDADAMEALNENQFAGINYRRWDTWVIEATRWRKKRYGPGAVIGEQLKLLPLN